MVDEPDFRWTTGNSEVISHQKWIDGGGFGEVHKVSSLMIVITDGLKDAQYEYQPGTVPLKQKTMPLL
jgi:hypothetical protein